MTKQILLIDADDARRSRLREDAERLSERRVSLCSPHEWRYRVEKGEGVEALLLGPCPGLEAQMAIYEAVRELRPFLPVLLYHPKGRPITLDAAEAVGSYVEVFEWPISDDALAALLKRALHYASEQQPAVERSPELFRALVGKSDGIARVRDLIERVSNSEASVLILGEPGTGKEVVARNLHYHSPRRGRPFVGLSCSETPEDILERELFGYEKGSFGNVTKTRAGCMEAAEDGTLYLDEIGDLTPSLQAKVLRVIADGTYERVGGTRLHKANVRIIGATSRDLEAEVRQGRFRADLYAKLNVIAIRMPPLRHRVEDISLLITELNARLMRERGFSVRLSPRVAGALQRYHWPGNVRELANLIERLAVLHPNEMVEPADLPIHYRSVQASADAAGAPVSVGAGVVLPPDGIDLKEYMNHVEYSLITQALTQTGGVVAHAANLLRIPRTTLIEKLRKYGVRSDSPVQAPATAEAK
jgi:sigma-54 dependent transcriptional regulator, flagellar regulatory protein